MHIHNAIYGYIYIYIYIYYAATYIAIFEHIKSLLHVTYIINVDERIE